MFTGIVEEVGKVLASGSGRLSVSAGKLVKGLALGDSVSVNGVCLTVTDLAADSFSVDVMGETLSRSNLGKLRRGDKVNLERAMALGGSMGGHLVQGHIDDTGKVSSIKQSGGALIVRIDAPPGVMRYVVEKGFIAVDGTSLTVTDLDDRSFQVSIVGFTRTNTIIADFKVGDTVNLEVDIIAKYVERFTQSGSGGVTAEFLREHGYSVN